MDLTRRWPTSAVEQNDIAEGDLIAIDGKATYLALKASTSRETLVLVLRKFGAQTDEELPRTELLGDVAAGRSLRKLMGQFTLEPCELAADPALALVPALSNQAFHKPGALVRYRNGKIGVLAIYAGRTEAFDLTTGALIQNTEIAHYWPNQRLMWRDGDDAIELFAFA